MPLALHSSVGTLQMNLLPGSLRLLAEFSCGYRAGVLFLELAELKATCVPCPIGPSIFKHVKSFSCFESL